MAAMEFNGMDFGCSLMTFVDLSAAMVAYEGILRLAGFVSGVMLFSYLEWRFPRRPSGSRRRWLVNYGLATVNTLAVRSLWTLMALDAAASLASANAWGLSKQLEGAPGAAVALGVIALDLVIYWQHRVFHAWPALWRVHRVHHSDVAIDVSTALRFHPMEIILSMGIKILTVVLLGIPPLAVLIFQVVLNFTAMFNHANWSLWPNWDQRIAHVLVTPDMHRIHHSVHLDESQSNFGFCLSLWDRLFRSYRAQPRDGHEGMAIGLSRWRTTEDQRFGRILIQPFERDVP